MEPLRAARRTAGRCFRALFFFRSGASGAFGALRSRIGCARFALPRHSASLYCESGGVCGRHVSAGRRHCASQRAHAGRHQNALAEKNRHADGTLYRHDRAFRCSGRAHGRAAFCLGRELELALRFLDSGSPAGADGLAAPDAVQDARAVQRIALLCTKASGG